MITESSKLMKKVFDNEIKKWENYCSEMYRNAESITDPDYLINLRLVKKHINDLRILKNDLSLLIAKNHRDMESERHL